MSDKKQIPTYSLEGQIPIKEIQEAVKNFKKVNAFEKRFLGQLWFKISCAPFIQISDKQLVIYNLIKNKNGV